MNIPKIAQHAANLYSRFSQESSSLDKIDQPFSNRKPDGKGDVGGTFEAETRKPFEINVEKKNGNAKSDIELGREALSTTLKDTDGSSQIQQDEFELIKHDNGNYTVVLAGVTDLSNPNLGLNPDNHTVRDVDQFAAPSSRSSEVEDNRYAELVREYILENVPTGANVMIVGHSYGADTALDLAADSTFNNPDSGVNVTHVVAAAYYSQPQIDDVQGHTDVLVLQNTEDNVVIGEAVAHTAAEGAELAYDITQGVLDGGLPSVSAPGAFELFDDGVTTPTDNTVVARFRGGEKGQGHHQDNYIDFVNGADATAQDPAVQDFYRSIAEAGYTENGESVAVDISVPDGEDHKTTFPGSRVAENVIDQSSDFWNQVPGNDFFEDTARGVWDRFV